MEPLKITLSSLIGVLAAFSMHAQQHFQNLNFEKANPVVDPGGNPYPYAVTAASALPSWTVYLGTIQQTDVLQNLFTLGQASVDVLGPNYQESGGGYSTIDGNYSVLLQAGNLPGSPALVGASIAQTGLVPLGSQSLQFDAITSPSFSVSFDGNNLSPVVLGEGPNGSTLYGADISAFAGQNGTLEFTALFSDSGASNFELDDIAFSSSAVPEPNSFALSAMGGLLFGARQWFARRG